MYGDTLTNVNTLGYGYDKGKSCHEREYSAFIKNRLGTGRF